MWIWRIYTIFTSSASVHPKHLKTPSNPSAIYYKMDAKTITKHCQAKFAANVEFTPKVLDAGETMVLFNLPRPWILLCGQDKRPTEIEFATYKVVDRKEFVNVV